MLASKVTEKYQATIPSEVRNFLHLKNDVVILFRTVNMRQY
jgi:AbrB family looped-hinge helix DNA binding protein